MNKPNIFKLIVFLILLFLSNGLHAQSINRVVLDKFRNRAEQEKVFNKQIKLLKLDSVNAKKFKSINFFYTAKALKILDEGGENYGTVKKLKTLKEEHNAVLKTILTAQQFIVWDDDRNKNGIVVQIMNK